MAATTSTEIIRLDDPPVARFLFGDLRIMPWIWLPLRIYLGWQWLNSGWGKFNNPAWVQTGEALRGFWERAVAVPTTPGASPAIRVDWYRDFIEFLLVGGHYSWFAKLITFGELAVGIALVVGAFVGLAAFFGGFMNWNFIMAGTASTNALLFAIAILLMLAWKNAGWLGLDRFLLPILGTPWQPGRVFSSAPAPGQVARQA